MCWAGLLVWLDPREPVGPGLLVAFVSDSICPLWSREPCGGGTTHSLGLLASLALPLPVGPLPE